MTAASYQIPNGPSGPQVAPNPGPLTRISPRFRRAIRAAGLGRTLELLDELVAHAEGSAVRLTQEALAAILGTSARTVQRHEADLARAGILRAVHHGRRNARLLVLERLDAQDVPARATRAAETAVGTSPSSARVRAAEGPGEAAHLLHRPSTGSPQSSGESRQPCRHCAGSGVTTKRERMIRIARDAHARVEEPLSDSSTRRETATAAAPWSAWRGGSNAALLAAGRGSSMPEWTGPSPAVDAALLAMHTRLAMWPNTLRQSAIWARDICRARGEERTLTYLDALERHCARSRMPGKLAYGALRRRAVKPSSKPALRQHVLEELVVPTARPLAGLVQSLMPQGIRHERAAR